MKSRYLNFKYFTVGKIGKDPSTKGSSAYPKCGDMIVVAIKAESNVIQNGIRLIHIARRTFQCPKKGRLYPLKQTHRLLYPEICLYSLIYPSTLQRGFSFTCEPLPPVWIPVSFIPASFRSTSRRSSTALATRASFAPDDLTTNCTGLPERRYLSA